MSEVLHRDKLHVQDDSPLVELNNSGPDAPEYNTIPVSVTNPVATTTAATEFGSYATIVLPANGNGKVLPQDSLREYAYIIAIDADVVLSTVREEAQSPNNQAASVPVPSGGYVPKGIWTPPIRHNEAVYAANTSTSAQNRVTVLVERGKVDG